MLDCLDDWLPSWLVDIGYLAWWLAGYVPALAFAWQASLVVGSGLVILATVHVPPLPRVTSGVAAIDWLIVLVLYDIAFYSYHRWILHGTRIGWWAHRFHHSGHTWWPLLGMRDHPLAIALTTAWKPALLGLVGAPWQLVGLLVVHNLWQHSTIGDSWRLEVLLGPAHHRVHHSVHERHHGRNYGSWLTLWDRLGGTYCPEIGRWEVGLSRPAPAPPSPS